MDKIHDIYNRIERIEYKLDNIKYMLENNIKSNDKMNEHIDFVDSVYNTMKTPITKICNIMSCIAYKPNSQEPVLEFPDKKNN